MFSDALYDVFHDKARSPQDSKDISLGLGTSFYENVSCSLQRCAGFLFAADQNERQEHQCKRDAQSAKTADAEHTSNGGDGKFGVVDDVGAAIGKIAGDLHGMAICAGGS